MKRLTVAAAAALALFLAVPLLSTLGSSSRGVALAAQDDTLAGCPPASPTQKAAAAPTASAPGTTDGCTPGFNGAAAGDRAGGATAAWDPGNIISDQVFYDTKSMTVQQIRTFIQTQNTACPATNNWCARTMKVSWSAYPKDEYCAAVPGRANADTAMAIAAFSAACGINPQVMLVTWQKESRGLDRTDPTAASYAAAWGWNCPDTGPGGTANCSPAAAGFVKQLRGMTWQWSKYRQRIPAGDYRYQVGKTIDILWNVEESGCGGSPVTIRNVATASLYVYTPYQPNAASLAAYPGEGDRCSSYGNRNFFRMWQKYFGDTGGGLTSDPGTPPAGGKGQQVGGTSGLGSVKVTYNGTTITVPSHAAVPAAVQGKQIHAPNPAVAQAIAAGLTWLGTPYSWGGGGAGGPSTGIDSGASTVGFDCSGLTSFVAAKWGTSLPRVSAEQRNNAHGVDWNQAKPGDLEGHPGHITIYLGEINGVRMRLEAPYTGATVRISPVPSNTDSMVYRYWATDAKQGGDPA